MSEKEDAMRTGWAAALLVCLMAGCASEKSGLDGIQDLRNDEMPAMVVNTDPSPQSFSYFDATGKIDGHACRVYLDMNLNRSVVSLRYAKSIGMKAAPSVVYSEEELPSRRSTISEFELGSMRVQNLPVYISDYSFSPAGDYGFDVMLGAEVLRHYLIALQANENGDDLTATLTPRTPQSVTDLAKCEQLDVHSENGVKWIAVEFNGKGPYRLIFNQGMLRTWAWLKLDAAKALGASSYQHFEGNSLNGQSISEDFVRRTESARAGAVDLPTGVGINPLKLEYYLGDYDGMIGPLAFGDRAFIYDLEADRILLQSR